MAAPKTSLRRVGQPVASTRRARRRERAVAFETTLETRLVTVLIVRWGLAALCLGLLLTAEASSANWVTGLAAAATLAASNVALARQQPEAIQSIALSGAIALLDALLVVTAWFASGHESFIMVIISLGLLNLALVGVSLTEIGAIALASLIFYLVMGQGD
jgi:hypothetical protein